MSRKDLHQKLKKVTTDVPELVGYYKSATRKVFGVTVDVRHGRYEDFRKCERKLKSLGISFRDYSYGVTTLLQSWVVNKKLRQLPTNVFLGKWALEKYTTIKDSEFVDFHYDESDVSELLQTELMVARYYIETASKGFVRFSKCVEDLQNALDQRWVELYTKGERAHLICDAIDILEEEYGVKLAKTYNDFVDAKVLNG
jgi:hypothetical protein